MWEGVHEQKNPEAAAGEKPQWKRVKKNSSAPAAAQITIRESSCLIFGHLNFWKFIGVLYLGRSEMVWLYFIDDCINEIDLRDL